MAVPAGIGAGELSPAAQARLARAGESHLPVPVPDLRDAAAVLRWRAAVHRAWGEDDDPVMPHHRVVVAGVPCLAAGSEGDPVVVHVHGGGHCLGSAAVAIPITARLAAAGLRVVSVDHRLAPEHPFPAALDDVLAVAGAVGADGPFALAGDSAGGGLAVAVAIALASLDALVPSALALFSPLVDHEPDLLDDLARAYLGDAPASHPKASPLHADLDGLPPTLVQVGGAERLLGQAVRFARRARAAGVDVTLDVWDGLWHTWHYHRDLPEADLALTEAAAFVRRHTPAPSTHRGAPAPRTQETRT